MKKRPVGGEVRSHRVGCGHARGRGAPITTLAEVGGRTVGGELKAKLTGAEAVEWRRRKLAEGSGRRGAAGFKPDEAQASDGRARNRRRAENSPKRADDGELEARRRKKRRN